MDETRKDIGKNLVKSNTSIVGIVCKDGVIMAGDRRATAGNLIMVKNARKVVKINDYIAISGTGVSSDIDMNQKVIAAELRLKELKSKVRPSVKEAANLLAMMMYRNIRTPSMVPPMVGMLIAGVDVDGKSSLYTIDPSGNIAEVEDYDANFSSGMPFILGLLERQFKKDMTIKEGIELAKECIKSSTQRDSGSGNGIDVFTITKEGIKQVVSEEIVPEYK
jgi:proteasome beta subunit